MGTTKRRKDAEGVVGIILQVMQHDYSLVVWDLGGFCVCVCVWFRVFLFVCLAGWLYFRDFSKISTAFLYLPKIRLECLSLFLFLFKTLKNLIK